MTRFYGLLFLIELLVVASAPFIFSMITSRLLAGMIAGAIFVGFGVFVLVVGLQVPSFRKTPTFWMGCLHLFGSALPLLVTRLMNFSVGFEDVRVLGLPGPAFHKLSTVIFAVLMLATVFDGVRSWIAGRKKLT